MHISPVSGALGAIIKDVNLADANHQLLDQIKSQLDEQLVLYFPDQQLDRFQLNQLARFFGPAFLHPLVNNGFSDCPDVLELLRKPEDSQMFGGENWHSDVSWQNPSAYVSILHGVEVPEVGGDTAYANTIAAFESLSEGLQDLLRNLNAVHCYHWYEGKEDPEHTVTHPVVRIHPVTKRQGLFVNRMFTSRFENMNVEESAPLLNYLFDHMQNHQFTCRFRWRAGGVIMWDNRFTLHYPINDFSGERRRMIRTTTLCTDNERTMQ